MNPTIETLSDADAVATRAAEIVVTTALQAVMERERFTWVLSGGSTPERLYTLLTQSPYKDQMPWEETFVFMGDERFVPEEDPAHNFSMARRALLDHVPVPPANRYPIETYLPSAADAADEYAGRLRDFFDGEAMVFDLILLGLGDDGHTASLFPGKPSLDETDKPVVGSEPGHLPPPVERVTLTFPVLNAARNVLFLVTGEKKREKLAQVLSGGASVSDVPAAGIKPVNGTLIFLADEAAVKK
ncbi:MAG: 6-phosphogluconolactonase [Akkermansiaceae bacterium]|nr:6-phosphogluconolactonase [Armatimonadota bacterium]